MNAGQFFFFVLVAALTAAAFWAARRSGRYLPFAAAEGVVSALYAVLGGWFVYDCLVANPASDGFVFTPVIRMVLLNDDYSYAVDFWPSLVWCGVMSLLCAGSAAALLILSRRKARAGGKPA